MGVGSFCGFSAGGALCFVLFVVVLFRCGGLVSVVRCGGGALSGSRCGFRCLVLSLSFAVGCGGVGSGSGVLVVVVGLVLVGCGVVGSVGEVCWGSLGRSCVCSVLSPNCVTTSYSARSRDVA